MDTNSRTMATAPRAAENSGREAQGAVMRPIAPEDLAPGMYITVMTQRFEWWPRSSFCEPSPLMLDRYPLRWDRAPDDSGLPCRVVGVCLPFVLAQSPGGDLRTLDVRSMSMARFNPTYGREAFARLARQAKRAGSSSSTGGDDGDDDD